MQRKPIDFKELLERLLPVDELPPADRVRVQRALVAKNPIQIEQAGLMALQQLEKLGAIQRVDPINGDPHRVRFQIRSALDLITLELPPTLRRDGIAVHPRVALATEARTGLDPVRRLMRLDDPSVFSDPRHGNARLGLLELLDQTGRELLGASWVRFIPSQLVDDVGPVEAFDPGLALQVRSDQRIVIACADTMASPMLEPEGSRRGVRSVALAGVFAATGEPIGHLEAASSDHDAFGVDELALLSLLADCFSLAWERSSRIEKLVFIDPLTGAFNRSYFDRQVANEMARAQREGTSFAMCIADIDNFKAFNTSYGYEAGNQVLVHVARTLKTGVRPFDSVARWGGEEFAVLLTAPIAGDDVVTICERLRALVDRQVVDVESLDRQQHRTGVTVSMGVALFPDDEKTPQDLFRAANQALLRAKQPPKNRVVYFRPPGEWRARPS